jgi:glycosyltransferase involved in cell wall biosynthesis
MKPRVVLVTGSAPPDVCGIGDYTRSLALALQKAGLPVEVFCHRHWGLRGTSEAIRRLLVEDCIVHIQYPTVGYGYSLGPQISALFTQSLVTLHEFSLAHPLRKLSLLPFTLRCPYIVMTSEFEKRSLASKMPWVQRRIRVIPIGSNIPPPQTLTAERQMRIAYFGLIMPRKGLEEFIEFSRLVRAKGLDWDVVIIGKAHPRHVAYAKSLMESSLAYRLHWILDRSPEEVSDLLSRTRLAYLPFPDGASERRGSLKAAFTSGLPCITTRSEQTPEELTGSVVFAAAPADALEVALRLMAATEEREHLSQGALKYSQRFRWERIAEAHVRLYQELNARQGLKE